MRTPRSWTDGQLTAALATAANLKQVCDALGLTPGGSTYWELQRRIDQLGLEFRDVALERPHPSRPRSWGTDEKLAEVVASSKCLEEVCEKLGLRPYANSYQTLRRHIARLGLPTEHLPKVERSRRRRTWTDDDLRRVVAGHFSVCAVLRELGYKPSGGMHRYITAKIKELGLDTSHFGGQA